MPLFLRVWSLLFLAIFLLFPKIALSADDIRQVSVPVDGLLYNPADGKLYGGVVSGANANSIVPLDPKTATLGTAVPLNSLPKEMVLSSDGHYIDTVVTGGFQIRRFDTTTQTVGIDWALGNDYSALYAEDIAALPGSPGSVLISRANTGLSPRHKDIVIFDNGVLRVTPNRAAGANFIEVNESGTRLYGYFAEISSFDFVRWDINSTGFPNGSSIHPIIGNLNFKYAGGRAYASNGMIFDPESGAITGSFSSLSLGMTLPDAASGKLFTASQSGTNVTIQVKNLNTLAPLGSIVVPNVTGTPSRLLRWGINGLAFRNATQVFLVRNSLVGILPPTVTGVNPNQGLAGDSVVLTGQDLSTTNSVKFNGVEATFHVDSDTQITATVPTGATTGPIKVTNGGGSTETSPFTVYVVPSISVGDASITEGNSGSQNLSFPLTLSNPFYLPVSVTVTTADGTATDAQDYTATSTTITIPAGQTTETVDVPVLGDTSNEINETFLLNLSNPTNANLGDVQGIGTILNDDFPTFHVSGGSITEGNSGTTNMNFTVTLSYASADAVSFDYATMDDTAVGGTDYTVTTGSGSFAPGQTSQIISVPIQGETTYEPNETFFLRFSNLVGAITDIPVAPNAVDSAGDATGTIINDDAVPGISTGDVTVAEGNSGTANADFSVTLTNDSSVPVTVNYATANGTAIAGRDYNVTSGTLTFNPGEKEKIVSVPIIGDLIDEEDETFNLNLSTPTNATISDAIGAGTITDDDTATFSVDSPSTVEGNSGTLPMNFTIKLSAPSSRTITVKYQTPDANSSASPSAATSDVDYIALPSTTLTFTPGQTTKIVTVRIKGDRERETNEQVALLVSGTSNITGDAQGSGTIVDDDGLPSLSINDVSISEGAGGTTTDAVFTVKLSVPTFQQVTVNYATANGTAVAIDDYTSATGTLTFAPGETSKSLTVTVQNDALDEENEAFSVLLSGSDNASVLKGTGVATIVDDDLAPSISLSPTSASLTERNSGTLSMNFSVRLSAPSGRPIQFTYQTANSPTNPATVGVDYVAVNPTVVVIPPGSFGVQVPVPVNGDTLYESDEHIGIVLSRPLNAALVSGKNIGDGTILNDDKAPSISISNVQSAEGNSGTKAMLFTVKLSAPSGLPASVRYTTTNGTALAGSDYLAVAGTLTFAPGETSKTISVLIKGDTFPEPNEQFRLVLSGAVGSTVSGGTVTALGTILNDDQAATGNPSAGTG
ncbi:hypothetical protein IAD21_05820 [Abditibacteriota bacterium]|nr:hypothetical protein IAD21_05820 [Abditibacteriota bacterium]